MTGLLIEYLPLMLWTTIAFMFTRKVLGGTIRSICLFLLGGVYWSISSNTLNDSIVSTTII